MIEWQKKAPNGNILSIISGKSGVRWLQAWLDLGTQYVRMCLFSSLCADLPLYKFPSGGLHAHIAFPPMVAPGSSKISLLAPNQWKESFSSPTAPVKILSLLLTGPN